LDIQFSKQGTTGKHACLTEPLWIFNLVNKESLGNMRVCITGCVKRHDISSDNVY